MVEGNYKFLDNPEFFNRLKPLENMTGRLRGTQVFRGTQFANRKNIQSVLTDDYFTCPVLDISNRMTSEERSIFRSIPRTLMTEAKTASSRQHKPDSNVSNNVERHFKICAAITIIKSLLQNLQKT